MVDPAALDLPHALVEWITILVVTREGDRRRKLRPSYRASVALVYLREHTTLAKIAAGFGISQSTAHTHTSTVIGLLAEPAPGLRKVPREADPQAVLLDGTLTEHDRVGDSRADHSHNHRRHRVNAQAATDPEGRLQWLSPAPPHRTHDLTTTRTHHPPPKRPSTVPWPQHRHLPNAASHDGSPGGSSVDPDAAPNLLLRLSSRISDVEVPLVAPPVTEKRPQNVHSSAGEGEDGLCMPFTFSPFACVEEP